jgi:hypothetical protein
MLHPLCVPQLATDPACSSYLKPEARTLLMLLPLQLLLKLLAERFCELLYLFPLLGWV